MNKENLKLELLRAAQAGTLLTPKHDPNNLSTAHRSYRSVLSYELATNLEEFIKSEDFQIREYENVKQPDSPVYIEIIPNEDSCFSVPASGVASNYLMPTEALDRLVAVSGSRQGWHLYGESQNTILKKIFDGELQIIELIEKKS